MNTTCNKCKTTYDDTYRWTFCPHETFEMHTKVFIDGVERCCHSIEELNAVLQKQTAAS